MLYDTMVFKEKVLFGNLLYTTVEKNRARGIKGRNPPPQPKNKMAAFRLQPDKVMEVSR